LKRAVPVSIFAARLAGMLLAGVLFPLTAAAQASPPTTTAIPAGARQQMDELSGPGGPLQGAMARINRMTDPNAGKRPGDEKLDCDQIRAEFDDTNRKYTAQSAKQNAANAVGAGDAYNEKLKAEATATQSGREASQNQFAQEAEASKALSDRGRVLMNLGQAKGCNGLVYKP
jgi:hypothetical protein